MEYAKPMAWVRSFVGKLSDRVAERTDAGIDTTSSAVVVATSSVQPEEVIIAVSGNCRTNISPANAKSIGRRPIRSESSPQNGSETSAINWATTSIQYAVSGFMSFCVIA